MIQINIKQTGLGEFSIHVDIQPGATKLEINIAKGVEALVHQSFRQVMRAEDNKAIDVQSSIDPVVPE